MSGSVSGVGIGVSLRHEQTVANFKALATAAKEMSDTAVENLTKVQQVIGQLDKSDLAQLKRALNSIGDLRFTEQSLEKILHLFDRLASKYELLKNADVSGMFRGQNGLIAQASELRMPLQATTSTSASPLYNPYLSMNSGSTAMDLNIHNLQRRLYSADYNYREGARPTAQMLKEVVDIAEGFKRAARSAGEYRDELHRLQTLSNAIQLGLPPEQAEKVIAQHSRMIAGMSAAASSRLDPVAAGMSAAGMKVPEYGRRPLDPIAAGMTRAAANRLDAVAAGMSMAGMNVPEYGQRPLDPIAAGMSAAARNRLDRVAAGMSMAGMQVPEYGQRPIDPVAAGMTAAARNRLDAVAAGMSMAGMQVPEYGQRPVHPMAARMSAAAANRLDAVAAGMSQASIPEFDQGAVLAAQRRSEMARMRAANSSFNILDNNDDFYLGGNTRAAARQAQARAIMARQADDDIRKQNMLAYAQDISRNREDSASIAREERAAKAREIMTRQADDELRKQNMLANPAMTASQRMLFGMSVSGYEADIDRNSAGRRMIDAMSASGREAEASRKARDAERRAANAAYRTRLDRAIFDDDGTGFGTMLQNGRLIRNQLPTDPILNLQDIWSDEGKLKARQKELAARLKGLDKAGPFFNEQQADLTTAQQMVISRLQMAQTNPQAFRTGRGSNARAWNNALMNVGFGLEDFVISSQIGGLPMALRSITNNITPMFGNLLMRGSSPALAFGGMVGATTVTAGMAIYAEHDQRVQQQAAESFNNSLKSQMATAGYQQNRPWALSSMNADAAQSRLDEIAQTRNSLQLRRNNLNERREFRMMSEQSGAGANSFWNLADAFSGVRLGREWGLWNTDWRVNPKSWSFDESVERDALTGEEYMLRRQERDAQMMLGLNRRMSGFSRFSDLSMAPLGRNATFDQRISQVDERLMNFRRNLNLTMDGVNDPAAERWAEQQQRQAVESAQQQKFSLQMDARQSARDVLDSLKDALDTSPSYVKSSRRLFSQIMGNSEAGMPMQLESLTNLATLLAKDQQRERYSEPTQQAGAIEGIMASTLINRSRLPSASTESAEALLQEIRDQIKELNRKMGGNI